MRGFNHKLFIIILFDKKLVVFIKIDCLMIRLTRLVFISRLSPHPPFGGGGA